MSGYISREAAIRVIDELYVKRPLDSDRFVLTGVGARLEELPAADVRENAKARWIDMGDHLLCSGCGATHYGADKNFCPNCGADMRPMGDENV